MAKSVNTVSPTRTSQVIALQKLIEGFKKHEQVVTLLMVLGQSMKVADIVTLLQTRLDATNAVTATKGTWQNAVKADHDQRAQTKAFFSALRQALLVAFAGQVDVLGDFGLVGRKPVTVAPDKRVAAIAKAKATRAARHTLGKNQKAAIKGNVTGVVIAPITEPTAETPPVSTPATTTPAPAGTPSQGPATNPGH